MKTVNQFVAAAFIISAMGSCQKEEISKNTSPGGDPSQVTTQNSSTSSSSNDTKPRSVTMTGSPGAETSGYGTISFEIDQVEAFVESTGWVSLNSESQTINSMELENGSDWTIASTGNIDASLIRQIKVTFGDQNFLNAGGSFSPNIIDLTIQQTHEVLINIDEQLQADESIALNLDLGASIHERINQFFFQPTIQFMGDVSTGIKGVVEGIEQAKVTVSNGTFSYTTYLSSNGEFIIRDMEAGTFDVLIEPQLDGLIQLSDKKISGIVIVEGRISNTQEINF